MKYFNVFIQCAPLARNYKHGSHNPVYKANLVRLKDMVTVEETNNPYLDFATAIASARKDLHVLYPVVEECDQYRNPIKRREDYYQMEV